jgi:trans-2,3-dihydro-3-hydroxyanthranilate isomerase
MQSIAAEFNLAETTFVLPPENPAHTAHVRIFTPKSEMPFAGHPNVGTAFVLARAGRSGDRFVFEEKAGLVPLDLTREAGVVVAARLAAPQRLTLGETVSAELVAQAVGLPAGDIVGTPVVASTGKQVPVRRGHVACGAEGRELQPRRLPQAPADGAHRRRPSPCRGRRARGRYPEPHVRAPVRRARRPCNRQRQ